MPKDIQFDKKNGVATLYLNQAKNDCVSWRTEELWPLFSEWTQLDGEAVAIFDGERPVLRRELSERASSVAEQLAAGGVGAGKRVLFEAYTAVDTAVVGLAVSKLGAIICPFSPKLGAQERQTVIGQLGPAAVIGRTAEEGAVRLEATEAPLFAHWRPESVTEEQSDARTVLIGFTSGTTGVPKAVPHTASSLNYTARVTAADIAGLQPGEPIIAISPLSSAPGWAYYVHMALTLGSPLVLIGDWDPRRVLELISKHQVAWGMCVPTHLHMMIDLARSGEWMERLTSMRALVVGGAPNSEAMVKNAEKYLGIKVVRMYAMSECLGHTTMRLTDPLERQLIYDGVPCPGIHLEAYDNDGQVLPRGEAGQAGVYGPSLFQGYLPGLGGDQNNFASDGAFLTGDLIIRDEQGYVQVVGRVKDQIIRGGLNIDASEVEKALASHPAVAEAALVGIPDERLGERLCAVVVPRPPHVPTLEQLCEHVQGLGLAKYKSPEFLVLESFLPKTEFGKIDKKKLQELAGRRCHQQN